MMEICRLGSMDVPLECGAFSSMENGNGRAWFQYIAGRQVVETTVSIWRAVVEKMVIRSLQGEWEVIDCMIPHGKHI